MYLYTDRWKRKFPKKLLDPIFEIHFTTPQLKCFREGIESNIEVNCWTISPAVFLEDTVKMKQAPAPWNKVFVKKDQHPVYLNENNRLRKKVSDLKKIQGNENKDIKIANGKVMIDNVVVDQNLFFR